MAAVMTGQWDVVIVGAGPVGTLLAGAVARHGASALLLERDTGISDQTRASTLNSRSMEIMSSLEVPGLEDRPHSTTGHYGGIPVGLDEVDSPWAGLWRMPQPDLVRLLRDWAVASGAVVRTGVTFTRAEARPSSVLVYGAAGETYESRYLVGADGAGSAVRTALGFTPLHVAATRHMIRCDVTGISVTPRRFERHGDAVVTAGQISPEIARLMLYAPRYRATDTVTFEDVCRDWLAATGEHVDKGECVWLDQFSNGCTTVARWDTGNVLLAGDAAHDQPPVGGSSLNSGLQDVHNLAWKLAALCAGAPGELAATYGRERAEATARMQQSVREQEALIFGADRRPGEATRARLERSPAFRRQVARSIAGLDTHYMGSTRTGPRLSPARFVRALRREPLPSETAALGRQAVIVTGDREQDVRLVVRPDGHVAWAAGHPDTDAAGVADRWFGDVLKPVVIKASPR
ncbi:FAD-dependent monooxygenase [Streptomyces sp. NPDC001093]|uniref:FAD-dependent monooxygenase n=1 Tax=Streptomyces sp. NPDC001093 TaxID=3154376 RepID=UPI00332CAB0B